MLNFEEELKKFKPSLEVEDIEEAVYQEDMTDMTEKMRDMLKEEVKANIILEVEAIKIMEMAFIRMIIHFQILFG